MDNKTPKKRPWNKFILIVDSQQKRNNSESHLSYTIACLLVVLCVGYAEKDLAIHPEHWLVVENKYLTTIRRRIEKYIDHCIR
jgi:hypothetical protein